MDIKDLVEIAEHSRTSCNESLDNAYPNEHGYVRCGLCAVLFYIRNNFWPTQKEPEYVVAHISMSNHLTFPKAITFEVKLSTTKCSSCGK